MATPLVFVVDDREDALSLNKMVLCEVGFTAVPFSNGAMCWIELQTRIPDLVVTDYDMPMMDGLELVRKIREAGMTFPILVTSSSFNQKTWGKFLKDDFLRAGATALLAKPFSPDELRELVKQFLGGASSAASATPE